MDRVPDNPVECVFVGLVGLVEGEICAQIGPVPFLRRQIAGVFVHFIQGDARRQTNIRGQIGPGLKAGSHQGRKGVDLVHGRDAQHPLHGVEHGGLVIELADHGAPFGVRTDHQTERAVSIDVVESVLGIVFDDDDARLRPKPTVRYGVDDASQCEVIVGDLRTRGRAARARARGVIVGQVEDDQVGPVPVAFERDGHWPNLIILYLPDDHTSGTRAGSPTPRAQVADNDLALGRVVDAISHSRFWAETCIVVIEDDPQNGFDHVDGHRSLCLVVSPYTKRGAVISQFYNQTSVLHTMQRMLGIPPMNQIDALSPLMTACFQPRPDLTPYVCLPASIPLDEMNKDTSDLPAQERHWADLSADLPLDQPDQADEDTLNRIVWHSVHGVDASYPVAFAGAHGKGLSRLGLRPDHLIRAPGSGRQD